MVGKGELSARGKEPVLCIVCGAQAVEQFLDLGHTALANKFLTRQELSAREPTYWLMRVLVALDFMPHYLDSTPHFVRQRFLKWLVVRVVPMQRSYVSVSA